MKRNTWLVVGAIAVAVCLGTSLFSTAQERIAAQRYEIAVIKWDGTDKVCVNLPDKSEIQHVFTMSTTRTPKEMQDEEFCLAWMANKMAKEGWDVVTLDSRRLVFRRAVAR